MPLLVRGTVSTDLSNSIYSTSQHRYISHANFSDRSSYLITHMAQLIYPRIANTYASDVISSLYGQQG